MLIGAIGVAYSMKIIFVAAGSIFAVAIVRTDVFEGRRLYQKTLGNAALIALMCALLFLIWKVTPKPKEPPSADEIANAVTKKLHDEIQPQAGTTPAQPNKLTGSVQTAPPRSPNTPPHKQDKRTEHAKSTEQEPAPAIPTPTPPPQVARLIVSQRQELSTREDAPYKTAVTIQTTTEFPSLKLLIHCDKPLVDGNAGMAGGGVLMMLSSGIVKDQPNYFVFSYGSATPPFGPQNPITAHLWSKEAIRCDAATF